MSPIALLILLSALLRVAVRPADLSRPVPARPPRMAPLLPPYPLAQPPPA